MMRSWSYTFKTSDGLKHEDVMSAATKDDVYAELRKKGIRAIKVEERIAPVVKKGFRGLRRRDWTVIAAAGLVAVSVGGWLIGRLGKAPGNVTPAPAASVRQTNAGLATDAASMETYRRLVRSVETFRERHRKVMSSIDGELLGNYALIEHSTDCKLQREEIARGRTALSALRDGIRAEMSKLYQAIPERYVALRLETERLYGVVMDDLDESDERLDGDECAISMLESHRGQWHVVHGIVEWKDDQLGRQFRLFARANMPTRLKLQDVSE